MKKALLVFLALIIAIVPLSGCKKNPDQTEYLSYWVDEEGNAGGNEADGTTSGGTTNGGTTSGGTTNGGKNEKPVVSGKTNFGGKTVTMAITNEPQYQTTAFKSMISAFEKKYNCKIKTSTLTFEKYNTLVNNQMSTGKSYDICFMHGSMYPAGPISGLYSDLTAALNSVKTENIDKTKSKENFSWNGKLYGVVGAESTYPYLMYYNKVMFEDADLDDPRELYEKGQWTWDKIFEMGAKATDREAGVYFLSYQYNQSTLYGESTLYIDKSTGKVVNNIRSQNVLKSLQLLQKIYVGNNAIGMPQTTEAYETYFTNGKCYMLIEESPKYSNLAPLAKKSLRFEKDVSNLGVVPLPLPAENTQKLYPMGWYTAVCAGAGADTTLAVLWADFQLGYESPVKSENEMSATDKALVKKLQSGATIPQRQGNYSTAGQDVGQLYSQVLREARNGGDLNKVVNDVVDAMNACIEATVGKGNYIVK